MSHSSRPSDDRDFLGLEERMSFHEDVALQEPFVPEELKGAHGGQEVALQRTQPELLTVEEAERKAESGDRDT